MGYVIVFVLSLAVGIGVFFATVRQVGSVGAPGFGDDAGVGDGPTTDQGPDTAYVPVTAGPHDWQARLTGILGLLVSVAVAAIALAISIYAVGLLIGKLFGSVAGENPPG